MSSDHTYMHFEETATVSACCVQLTAGNGRQQSLPPDRLIQEVLTLCGQVYPVVTEEPSPAFLKRELCIMFPDCDAGHFLLAVLCQPCVDCLRPPRVLPNI